MKSIAIVNQKGGVCKTATAVNLAYNLSRHGQRVCLIDFDPQANATSHCGVRTSNGCKTVYDFLKLPESAEIACFDDVAQETHGFFVIPSNRKLGTAKSEEPSALKSLMFAIDEDKALQAFDFVIIDGPPSPGFLNNLAICASDEIIIPTICRYHGVEAVGKVIKTIEMLNQNIMGLRCKLNGIVPQAYNKSIGDQVRNLDVLRKHFNGMLYQPIRQSTQVGECSGKGVPVELYDKKCNGAADYRDFSQAVLTGKMVYGQE